MQNDIVAEPTVAHRSNRKKKVVAATLAMVAIGGAAFAYWTAGGSGTGAADTGTTIDITVNQTSTVTDLAPGSGTQELSGTFTNTNAEPVYVAAVTAEVTSVKVGGVEVTDACAEDYLIGGTATVGQEVVTDDTWSGLNISMTNTGISQDACKDAQLVITYTAS